MITRMRVVGVLLVGVLSLSSTGCIVIGPGGWNWSCCGSTVWTEPVTERLAIDTADLEGLEVRTHNGSIKFSALPAGSTDAYVTVTKKAGGRSGEDARAAFEALEVFVESAAGGMQRLGWRWRGLRHSRWNASVSFDIKAPGDIRFDGKTHNGPVDVEGVSGDVRVVTHNGGIDVASSEGPLYCETHNGKVVADYAGADVTLVTHNGRILADLSRCAVLGGTVATHNGGVEVVLGSEASADLTARTYNGSISCDVPLTSGKYSKRTLKGIIGDGQGKLDLTTHNGGVCIKKDAG